MSESVLHLVDVLAWPVTIIIIVVGISLFLKNVRGDK